MLLVDLDLVGDAVHAKEACDVVVGGVALELEADVTGQGDPAVLDLDVNQVRRDVGVPDQRPAMRDAAVLVVVSPICAGLIVLELLIELIDTIDLLGVSDSSSALSKSLDRAAQNDRAVLDGHGDLCSASRGIRGSRSETPIDHRILERGVLSEHEAPFARVPLDPDPPRPPALDQTPDAPYPRSLAPATLNRPPATGYRSPPQSTRKSPPQRPWTGAPSDGQSHPGAHIYHQSRRAHAAATSLT